jgi:mono/diheme cytochrome c family protein
MESVMTDCASHLRSGSEIIAGRLWRLGARIARASDRTLFAHRIRYDLNELPNRLRRDIGLIRMALALVVVVPALLTPAGEATAQDSQIRRGQYLVTLGGCNDCHTPGYFFGKPDMTRFLGGSEVGFEIPGLGVFHGPNLTPDAETGLGAWSLDQIAVAITKGQRPDGRELAPIMPWHAFANLTAQDVRAIAIYLRSLPPVKNRVPGPFGPSEHPTSFVMKIVPPQPAATDGAAREK